MNELSAQLGQLLAGAFSSGPASETVISAAEHALGVVFPPSYRMFLCRYGASLLEGLELYGLPMAPESNQPPQWTNAVNSSSRLLRDSMPVNSVQISHDGVGHGLFLLCSTSDTLFEGPVVEWGPSQNGGEAVAPSFIAFLESRTGG